MTDATDTPAAAETPNSFTVTAQFIRDLSFENPKPLESLQAARQQPDVSVNIDVTARKLKERVFEVDLHINATATRDGAPVFVVELVYAGIFSLPELPAEHEKPFVLIECPRFLFPFARNIVAMITAEGGFPPLMLQPVDFTELLRRSTQKTQNKPIQG